MGQRTEPGKGEADGRGSGRQGKLGKRRGKRMAGLRKGGGIGNRDEHRQPRMRKGKSGKKGTRIAEKSKQ